MSSDYHSKFIFNVKHVYPTDRFSIILDKLARRNDALMRLEVNALIGCASKY